MQSTWPEATWLEVLCMRRFATVAVVAVATLILPATAAWAAAPKFHSVMYLVALPEGG